MFSIQTDRWQAWGASFLLHVTVLLSLSAIVWREASRSTPMVIETQIVDSGPLQETFAAEITVPDIFDQGGLPAAGLDTGSLTTSAPKGHGLTLSASIGPLAGGGGTGLGGAGGGAGAGDGKSLGFFGTRGTGKSVVFVVDMSGSMEGIRFIRAQQELVKAIHKLDASQKFYVIFFNQHAVPLFFPRPPRELVAATPKMKRSATRWIVERHPVSGTEPEEALGMALALKPEVIYFLTDGEFPEQCREVCRQKNTYGAVINTIALQSRDGIPLLEAIARDHKGTFKLVK